MKVRKINVPKHMATENVFDRFNNKNIFAQTITGQRVTGCLFDSHA